MELRLANARPTRAPSRERIQQANASQRDQHAPALTEKPHPEEWSFGSPMPDPPGPQAGNESWGDDQEDSRADDRPSLPHHARSEEHTSELQSLRHLVCRLLLEKKKK